MNNFCSLIDCKEPNPITKLRVSTRHHCSGILQSLKMKSWKTVLTSSACDARAQGLRDLQEHLKKNKAWQPGSLFLRKYWSEHKRLLDLSFSMHFLKEPFNWPQRLSTSNFKAREAIGTICIQNAEDWSWIVQQTFSDFTFENEVTMFREG